jgi:EmrB/QacA subfamily drug resistance transporter
MPPARAVRVPFAALVLAMLPAVLDQTILATALPTIAADLGRLADVSWLVSAYVIAATVSTPLWGKLGDRLGRKRLLELSLVLFVGTSALCGLAGDLTQLLIARAVQGVGAGGLMTLAMASVGDLVSPRERGRYQGYIASTFAAATILGPLIGGVLVDHASWRWVFYVNLPVGALALAALRTRLPAAPGHAGEHPVDLLGAALLAGGTSALLLMCLWGGDRYAWGSATIVTLLVAAAALAAGLIARERRAPDPIVPLEMLAGRTVAVASATLFLATAALFAVTVFVPLFLQAVTGASPTRAGLLLAPMMAATALSTTLSGRRIARTGRYRRLPAAGLAAMTAGLVLLGALADRRSAGAAVAGVAVFGLGFGLVTQVLVVAVQNSVERQQLATATAAASFFRALGGAVGAAALGAVFATHAGGHIGSIAALGPAAHAHLAGALQTVFLAAAPLAAAGMLIVLALPEAPLRTAEDRRDSAPAPQRAPS